MALPAGSVVSRSDLRDFSYNIYLLRQEPVGLEQGVGVGVGGGTRPTVGEVREP